VSESVSTREAGNDVLSHVLCDVILSLTV